MLIQIEQQAKRARKAQDEGYILPETGIDTLAFKRAVRRSDMIIRYPARRCCRNVRLSRNLPRAHHGCLTRVWIQQSDGALERVSTTMGPQEPSLRKVEQPI